MSHMASGIIGILALLLVMTLGVPIGWAMGILGLVGLLLLGGMKSVMGVASTVPFTTSASYVLSAIPMFVLMGHFISYSGIGSDLFRVAYKWMGRLPGGVGLASLAASGGFAALSGSSLANAASIGAVGVPEMKKLGYDMSFACGLVAAGGTLGILIPPSNAFILYGVLTETSVAHLFLAGLFPGVIMMLLMMAITIVLVRMRPHLAPKAPPTSWSDKFGSLPSILPAVAIFVVIMGGIYGGVFTPSEAAGVGAFLTFLVVVARRRLSWDVVRHSLADTARITSMVFGIIIGAMVYGYFLAITRFPVELATWVTSLALPPLAIVIAILFVFMVAGCFMDGTAMMILFIPIFAPVFEAIGYNLYLAGVLIVITVEMGMITPPVGMNVFVLSGVVGVKIYDIFRGIWPMLIAQALTLPFVIIFPILTQWPL